MGPLLGLKAAFRAMRPGGAAGRGGVVVNVSSMAALTAYPATAAYAATKAGVERLTKVAAVESARLGYGVRVNCVYPGLVATELSQASAARALEIGLFPDAATMQSYLMSQIPFGRTGAPEDVAEAVAFLASDAASYITGVGLPVAGGLGSNTASPNCFASGACWPFHGERLRRRRCPLPQSRLIWPVTNQTAPAQSGAV